MACGQPGKKIHNGTRDRAIQLLQQGLSVDVVCQRLNLSKSLVRSLRGGGNNDSTKNGPKK